MHTGQGEMHFISINNINNSSSGIFSTAMNSLEMKAYIQNAKMFCSIILLEWQYKIHEEKNKKKTAEIL